MTPDVRRSIRTYHLGKGGQLTLNLTVTDTTQQYHTRTAYSITRSDGQELLTLTPDEAKALYRALAEELAPKAEAA